MILSSVGARGHCGRPESWRVMGGAVMGPPHSSEPPTLVHSNGDCCRASRLPSLARTRVVTSFGNWPRTVNTQELTAVWEAANGAVDGKGLTGGSGTADFDDAGWGEA